MLKGPMVSPRRQRAGQIAVAVLALATGFAAWAAQPKRIAPVVVPDGHLHAQQQVRVNPYRLRDGESVAEPVLVLGKGRPAANVFEEPQLASAPPPPPVPPAPPVAPNRPAAPAPPAPPATSLVAPTVAPPPPPPAPAGAPSALPAPPAPPAPPAAPAPPSPPPAHHAPPRDPAVAVEQKLSGRVVLLVDVDTNGHPTAIKVESADPPGVFEQEAARAASQWQFQPSIEGGRAVPSKVRVPVDFRIDGPPPAAAPEA